MLPRPKAVVLKALVATAVVTGAHRVQAQQPAAALVEKGVKAYLEGEYEGACRVLEQALEAGLDDERRAYALQYLAFGKVALGQRKQAERAFGRLLRLKPNFRLPAATAPKIVAVFERARTSWEKTRPRIVPVIVSAGAKHASEPMRVVVRVLNPPADASVFLRWRDGESGGFGSRRLAKTERGYEAVLAPPLQLPVKRYYYLELADGDGRVIDRYPGTAGAELLVVEFERGGEPQAVKNNAVPWWVWVLAGVAVAGAGAGVAVWLSSSGSRPGGRAIVEIVVP